MRRESGKCGEFHTNNKSGNNAMAAAESAGTRLSESETASNCAAP